MEILYTSQYHYGRVLAEGYAMGDMLKAVAESMEEYKDLCTHFDKNERIDARRGEHLADLKRRKRDEDAAALRKFQKKFGHLKAIRDIGLGYQIVHIIVYAKGKNGHEKLRPFIPEKFKRLPVEIVKDSNFH